MEEWPTGSSCVMKCMGENVNGGEGDRRRRGREGEEEEREGRRRGREEREGERREREEREGERRGRE